MVFTLFSSDVAGSSLFEMNTHSWKATHFPLKRKLYIDQNMNKQIILFISHHIVQSKI